MRSRLPVSTMIPSTTMSAPPMAFTAYQRSRIHFDADSVWSHLSLYHTLGRVQSWVFGFLDFSDVQTSAGILIVLTVASLVILARRVAAPMRA